MQLKTSKQLLKIRQCLVRMGVPAHDDKRSWKVVTRASESKSVQERNPYTHHAAGVEQGGSIFARSFELRVCELIDNLQC